MQRSSGDQMSRLRRQRNRAQRIWRGYLPNVRRPYKWPGEDVIAFTPTAVGNIGHG